MPDYRFYWLGFDGRIETAANFSFADDKAALSHADVIAQESAVEVWQGARKLVRLERQLRQAG